MEVRVYRLLEGRSVSSFRTSTADEEIFGGGFQFHSLAQRGKSKFLKVNADPRDDVGNSHAVTPFFLSTRGYGIFLNTNSYSNFDFGKTDKNIMEIRSNDPVLDYYLFYGPTFHDLLQRYTQLTGRMQMPPKWGLGFWYRMKSDWKADKAEAIAREFRGHQIPCDVLGLEPAWQTHAYSCSYLWSRNQFPDPAAFVADMRGLNFHVNLWEHAYVHPTSPIHDPLQTANVVADKLVWGGLVPDFTLPAAGEIFAGLHKKEHIDLGVDGYKLDECDGSDYTGGWFFPDDTKFPGGMSGAQMHNVFGFLYQKSFHEMFDKMNHRSYFLCRANYAGGQAYPTVVYSDWYDFKDYVRAACNSGFSGMLWCPEVRQTGSSDEFVRRIQTVFFSPLAMINAWETDGVTPWEKGPEVERIFRTYAGLRSQLTPYLYNAFHRMNRTGLPVVRALAVDWPEDRETYAVDDEFMYGESMLIAPVFSGDTRTVYLPAGNWTDWWTGEQHTGPVHLTYSAPLERLPIFVRGGSAIAMQPPMQYSGEMKSFPLELRLYPGSSESVTTLYDDDGTTLDYRKGISVEVDIRSRKVGSTTTINVSKTRGTFTPAWSGLNIKLIGIKAAPKRVEITPSNSDSTASNMGAEKYVYDKETGVLTVALPYGTPAKITVIN